MILPNITAVNAAKQPSMMNRTVLVTGAFLIVGLAIPTIILSINANRAPVVSVFGSQQENYCDRSQLVYDNVDCVHTPGPQAGANVTKGFRGQFDMGDIVPLTDTYFNSKMCPVNVHWHLGTEHYSKGEYDENGTGPTPPVNPLLEADGRVVRQGYRCNKYDSTNPMFTRRYPWQFCIGMQVGETYEVHWPHSSAGACGTVDQYQTPFYDGVFCNLDHDAFKTLGPQDIANNVGVQAQVFTIVNDERYYYPNLLTGMIVDKVHGYGQDLAYYTGSTTGTLRSNEMCSVYTPVTWQVDRKCQLISASSFDNLCRQMQGQRDSMILDMHAHGSRELVKDEFVANNQVGRRLWADGSGELHEEMVHDHDDHDHHHDHDHDHHHHHHEWF